MEIASSDGTVLVPLEDLSQILAHGANIRLSTMDLSILAQNRVSLMTLDEKYLPTAIVLPFEGHSRQSKLMHAQVMMESIRNRRLWEQIIARKIGNQAGCLTILGLNGADRVSSYLERLDSENVDSIEALSAKEYFSFYHSGLNRRTDDPLNSRLNYGYAVVRGFIARTLVAAGFHPTFGIHHDSQLNAFNLADDLIEPYRAITDLTAYANIGTNVTLSKSERREMAHTLHNACMVGSIKVNVMTAIEMMCESLKRIVLDNSDEELLLPRILPVESLEGITE